MTAQPWVWPTFIRYLWPKRKKTTINLDKHVQFLQHSVRTGNRKYLESLDGVSNYNGLLHIAVTHRQLSITEYLIGSGVNVNATNREERSALHIAASIGSVQCAEILLKYKADINARNIWGRTPLLLAVVNNHDKLTKFLVSQGADINRADQDGKVAIHILTSYGKREMLAYFLNLPNINKEAEDRHGRSVIAFATEARNPGILQLLFNSGCMIKTQSVPHYSTLHNVIVKYNLECVEILFHGGAPVEFAVLWKEDGTRNYYTPFQLCLHQLYVINAMSPDMNIPHIKISKNITMLEMLIKANGSTIKALESLNKIIHISKSVAFSDYTVSFNKLIRKLLLIGYIENKVTGEQLAEYGMEQAHTLQNLCRMHIRKQLMLSKTNLFWACDNLDVPNILKCIILLEDI